MNVTISLKSPNNKNDLDNYFHFRWLYLRKPLGASFKSCKDDLESKSHHIMAISNQEIIGVGRIHKIPKSIFQIRYMAVSKEKRGLGIGSRIIKHLESIAVNEGATKIILHAREKALQFYSKNGYKKIKKTHKIMGEIQHYLMEKYII